MNNLADGRLLNVLVIGPDRARCARWRTALELAEVQLSALSDRFKPEALPDGRSFDLVILDASGREDAVELVRSIRAGLGSARVLVLSDSTDDALLIELIRAGA